MTTDLYQTPGRAMARDRRHAKAEPAKGGRQHPPTYATLRMTLHVKSPIFRTKAEYEGCAAWNAPRGVSSLHVLVRAFGDAYMRRENVRHATLLFCAEGVGPRKGKAREK